MFTRNSSPIIGIEIETTLRNCNDENVGIRKIKDALENWDINNPIDWCTVKRDDTSSAETVFEIILPPMAYDDLRIASAVADSNLFFYLQTIQNALESINARITVKCGGHVHFGMEWLDTTKQSVNDFNQMQINAIRVSNRFYSDNKTDVMPFQLAKAVGYRYGLNQQIFNKILPNSRTNNTYCRPIDNKVTSSEWNNSNTLEQLNRVIGGKFNAVNYQNSWNGKKTIEFRQNSGSIEADKILNWVKLITNLYRTTDREFLQYQNDLTENTTPDQPYRIGTRLAEIWSMCRSEDGASVQDLMLATGTTRSNIAGRISEMRSRFGDGAIVTSTQQANGRSYGSGDEFASYKILKTFRTGDNTVSILPDNRAGNPSIWNGINDDLYDYFHSRAERFQ